MHCILCEPHPTLSTPFTQLFQFQPSNSLNSCHTAVLCIVFCVTLIPCLVLLSLIVSVSVQQLPEQLPHSSPMPYMLCDPIPSPMLLSVLLHDLFNKHSSSELCHFLCWNATYELHIFHVQYLCEKWFCRKGKEWIPGSIVGRKVESVFRVNWRGAGVVLETFLSYI